MSYFPDTEEVTGSIPVPPTRSTSENSRARIANRGLKGTIDRDVGWDYAVGPVPGVTEHPVAPKLRPARQSAVASAIARDRRVR